MVAFVISREGYRAVVKEQSKHVLENMRGNQRVGNGLEGRGDSCYYDYGCAKNQFCKVIMKGIRDEGKNEEELC